MMGHFFSAFFLPVNTQPTMRPKLGVGKFIVYIWAQVLYLGVKLSVSTPGLGLSLWKTRAETHLRVRRVDVGQQ